MKKLERIELTKDFVQQAVDRGATSLEEITQYIADLPFEALERTGLLDSKAGGLRTGKERTIGVVYDAIREINRQIGQLVSDQFENVEDARHVAKVLKENAARHKTASPTVPVKNKKPR